MDDLLKEFNKQARILAEYYINDIIETADKECYERDLFIEKVITYMNQIKKEPRE